MFKLQRVVEVEVDQLRMLAFQAAGTLLYLCQERDPRAGDELVSGGYDTSKQDPIMKIMSRYVSWAPHGFTNALQSLASVVYDYVQLAAVDDFLRFSLEPREIELLTDALSAYQDWKTAHINEFKRSMGPGYEHFGDATKFNQMDWTDRNRLLIHQQSA